MYFQFESCKTKNAIGCDMAQMSALFAMAYANGAGGMMKLLMVDDAAQEYRIKGKYVYFMSSFQE